MQDKSDIYNLSSEYFTDDTETFYLTDTNKAQVVMSTGGYEEYTLSKDYQQLTPEKTTAYKIQLKSWMMQQRFTIKTEKKF